MFRFAVSAVLVLAAAVLVGAPAASAAKEKPGAPYYATERQLENFLKQEYDFAHCFGIQRFGTRGVRTGDYRWEKAFTRFECSWDTGTTSCFKAQIATVNHTKRGFWTYRVVRGPRCY